MRKCSMCSATKAPEDFYSGRYNYCRKCASARTAQWNRDNPERHRANTARYRERYPERVRESQRQSYARNPEAKREYAKGWYGRNKERSRVARYGLTLEEYEAMKTLQDGRCRICGESCELVVDHEHATGAVRGLLCGTCNSGLGFLKDSPLVLRKAAEYLEEWFGST